ncbi:transposase [Fulvivirgaceae bacterium PWU4]|uniref:Transposase n=1 Tax=Chryseosolibacter histidini TaxID=2782349 RepID=A0AAP2GM93_9BACT|nr:transposase [Chryseosolibacter histidini]
MKFQADNFYHVFNRGNNKQVIFPRKENYNFFLKKLRMLIVPNCNVISYCLMPNHFHLLIHVTTRGNQLLSSSGRMQTLERKLGTLQSSYTRAINIQESKTGSLFQPKCKVIELDEIHLVACFHYIHQNPVKAGLCSKFENWNFSSYREYCSEFSENICNREIAYDVLQLPRNPEQFKKNSMDVVVDSKVIERLEL